MSSAALDLAALEAAGEQIGRDATAHSVLWLNGPLGAGKTTLVRAVVRGRGVADAATSPTYNLVHHYEGPRGSVYHVDCYRLRSPDDAADLDWETLVSADLLLIEWPERAGPWAPPPTMRIELGYAADDTRSLDVR